MFVGGETLYKSPQICHDLIGWLFSIEYIELIVPSLIMLIVAMKQQQLKYNLSRLKVIKVPKSPRYFLHPKTELLTS